MFKGINLWDWCEYNHVLQSDKQNEYFIASF